MKTNWFFKDCENHRQQARAYWEKKAKKLQRLLSNYRAESRRIRLTLYHHQARDEWELRGVLHLPTGMLIAEETGATLHEVIDKVGDELAQAIRRHKSQLRKDHLIRRRSRRREELSAAVPYLARDASSNRKSQFVSLLLPHMDQVYDHAKRELAILELEGTVPVGQWTPRDLVDDVLVRACESYGNRPQATSLDVWLVELLNTRLEKLRHEIKPITLSATDSSYNRVDDEIADVGDIEYWMRHLVEPSESPSLEELLPDDDLGDVWNELTLEEQRDQLAKLLGEFPKYQRQALILHDSYGFELTEIAASLNRTQADIEADIRTGREKLRKAFSLAGCAEESSSYKSVGPD